MCGIGIVNNMYYESCNGVRKRTFPLCNICTGYRYIDNRPQLAVRSLSDPGTTKKY